MFDRRVGLPHTALLRCLAAPLGGSRPVIAETVEGAHLATYRTGPAYPLARYANAVLELQRELNPLVLADERGASVIASARYRLENSVPQRLSWQRDAEGRMAVSRDDEALIDVDRGKTSHGIARSTGTRCCMDAPSPPRRVTDRHVLSRSSSEGR